MGFAAIKEHACELFNEAPFISQIRNESDYTQALALMDELIEDYDNQKPLIHILSASIACWENKSPEFKSFNDRIEKIDSGIATLKVIMEQYELGVGDLPEIGSKSLVSRILNGQRRLTRNHIEALCKRYKISPALFF
ncbi:MAG: transcriptional regulator [Gammaproteobacteria bacterium]|nr:transcriptional regulator [Gammaproteobacteria bacterium]